MSTEINDEKAALVSEGQGAATGTDALDLEAQPLHWPSGLIAQCTLCGETDVLRTRERDEWSEMVEEWCANCWFGRTEDTTEDDYDA